MQGLLRSGQCAKPDVGSGQVDIVLFLFLRVEQFRLDLGTSPDSLLVSAGMPFIAHFQKPISILVRFGEKKPRHRLFQLLGLQKSTLLKQLPVGLQIAVGCKGRPFAGAQIPDAAYEKEGKEGSLQKAARCGLELVPTDHKFLRLCEPCRKAGQGPWDQE